jgi:hypothetical protein
MESSNRGHCVYLGIKEGLIKIWLKNNQMDM